MNKLLIDTTDQKTTKVGLSTSLKTQYLKSHNNYKSQETLKLVKKIIEKNDLKIEDIDEIEVNPGPGSFTGIKVGISIANALGFSLGVKVNGKKPGEVEALYF